MAAEKKNEKKSGGLQGFYAGLSREDKNAVRDLTKTGKIDFIPTGSWVIDLLIGDGSGNFKSGGLPRGHVVEVFGDESCGKTTLGVSACVQAQKMGLTPVWLDYERTFHKDYAKLLGLDLDPSRFALFEPNHFEHGIRIIDEVLPAAAPGLIVVDSVSAMVPKQFLEGKIDEMGRIGLQAQLMSMGLNIVTKKLQPNNTCLLFLNQLRSVIKTAYADKYKPDEESSGGKALKFYSSVRLQLKKGAVERVAKISRITGIKDKEPVNVTVRASVIKNKIDKPAFSGPLYIRFGDGFDNINSIIELAVNTNVIKASGPFYKFDHAGKTLFNEQGRENLRALLEREPKTLDLITGSIKLKEDEETKKAVIEEGPQEESAPSDIESMMDQASETFVKNKKAKTKSEEEKDD